jgi:hypothetical protein
MQKLGAKMAEAQEHHETAQRRALRIMPDLGFEAAYTLNEVFDIQEAEHRKNEGGQRERVRRWRDDLDTPARSSILGQHGTIPQDDEMEYIRRTEPTLGPGDSRGGDDIGPELANHVNGFLEGLRRMTKANLDRREREVEVVPRRDDQNRHSPDPGRNQHRVDYSPSSDEGDSREAATNSAKLRDPDSRLRSSVSVMGSRERSSGSFDQKSRMPPADAALREPRRPKRERDSSSGSGGVNKRKRIDEDTAARKSQKPADGQNGRDMKGEQVLVESRRVSTIPSGRRQSSRRKPTIKEIFLSCTYRRSDV